MCGLLEQGERTGKDFADSECCTGFYNVSKPEHPLPAFDRLDCFKLFLFDTGLLKTMAGVDNRAVLLKSDYQFKGPLSENYVLQQLWGSFDVAPRYYADKHGELDFILQRDGFSEDGARNFAFLSAFFARQQSMRKDFYLLLKADKNPPQRVHLLKGRGHDKIGKPNSKPAAQKLGKNKN